MFAAETEDAPVISVRVTGAGRHVERTRPFLVVTVGENRGSLAGAGGWLGPGACAVTRVRVCVSCPAVAAVTADTAVASAVTQGTPVSGAVASVRSSIRGEAEHASVRAGEIDLDLIFGGSDG